MATMEEVTARFGIDVPGVRWDTGTKGVMNVELEDGTEEEHDFVRVPLPKASIKDDPIFAVVDVDRLPPEVRTEIYVQGLKNLLNRGPMTSIKGPKTEKSREAATEAAKKNLEALYAGQIRLTPGLKSKIPQAVKVVAMNKARFLVREAMKANGMRVSHFTARTISEAADQIINSPEGAELIEEAKQEVAARQAKAKSIDLSGMKPDPELMKKDQEKAASKKAAAKASPAELAKLATQRGRPQANV